MRTVLVVDTRLMLFYRFHRKQSLLGVTTDIANVYYSAFGKRPDEIIFAMDKGASRRAEVYKEYKAHRKEAVAKKSVKDQKALIQFNEDYNKFEEYLTLFGVPLALKGVEADDIASILAFDVLEKGLILPKDTRLVLMSSDSDWVKFLVSENVSILNPLKRKLITTKNCEEVYGVTPSIKIIMDCLTGVSKENVKGIKQFGPKKFLEAYKSVGFDENKLLKYLEDKYDGTDKLPSGFTTVREMFDFNYELFRPWTYKDLSEEEFLVLQDKVKKGRAKKVKHDDIMLKSYELFGALYPTSYVENKFYNIKA